MCVHTHTHTHAHTELIKFATQMIISSRNKNYLFFFVLLSWVDFISPFFLSFFFLAALLACEIFWARNQTHTTQRLPLSVMLAMEYQVEEVPSILSLLRVS